MLSENVWKQPRKAVISLRKLALDVSGSRSFSATSDIMHIPIRMNGFAEIMHECTCFTRYLLLVLFVMYFFTRVFPSFCPLTARIGSMGMDGWMGGWMDGWTDLFN